MADDQQSGGTDPETSKIKRDKLTLKKLDPDKAASAPSETRLSDPAARRETNTASLKRIRPKTSIGETTQTDDRKEDTETIHLKVIKEKKNINQLKNLLSASQTIRLRPSTGGAESAPAAEASGGDDGAKKTLKIKAPGAADAVKTENIGRAPLRAAGSETKAASTPAPENPTTKISSKSTLKIKAPPGAGANAPTSGSPTDIKKKSTLKIKAPTAAGGTGPSAETVRQHAPAASAQTVKQEAPTSGKTLKLKSRSNADEGSKPQEMPDPSIAQKKAAIQAQKDAEAAKPVAEGSPIDVGLSVLALIASAAAAVVLFMGMSLYS